MSPPDPAPPPRPAPPRRRSCGARWASSSTRARAPTASSRRRSRPPEPPPVACLSRRPPPDGPPPEQRRQRQRAEGKPWPPRAPQKWWTPPRLRLQPHLRLRARWATRTKSFSQSAPINEADTLPHAPSDPLALLCRASTCPRRRDTTEGRFPILFGANGGVLWAVDVEWRIVIGICLYSGRGDRARVERGELRSPRAVCLPRCGGGQRKCV